MLISFEGIDGTGKATQALLLRDYLDAQGIRSIYFDFPAYGSFVGREVGYLLSSDSAKKEIDALSLPPKIMAMLFALDRMQFFDQIRGALAKGETVITNRFSLSNSVFQSIRAGSDISNWVSQLEHEALGLPRPDYYIVLLGDINSSKKLIASKGIRIYTEEHDIYEKNETLLAQAQEMYKTIDTKYSKKIIVNCFSDSKFRSPENIHSEICNRLYDLMKDNNIPHNKVFDTTIISFIDRIWQQCVSEHQLNLACIQKALISLPSKEYQSIKSQYDEHAKSGIFFELIQKNKGRSLEQIEENELDLCIFLAALAYAANAINNLLYYPQDIRNRIKTKICETLHASNDDLIALDRAWGRLFYSF